MAVEKGASDKEHGDEGETFHSRIISLLENDESPYSPEETKRLVAHLEEGDCVRCTLILELMYDEIKFLKRIVSNAEEKPD